MSIGVARFNKIGIAAVLTAAVGLLIGVVAFGLFILRNRFDFAEVHSIWGVWFSSYLPYLAGERSPIWDPAARGVFYGVGLATGRAEFARAVLEHHVMPRAQ